MRTSTGHHAQSQLHTTTPEMRTSTGHHERSQLHRTVYKTTPEMRTPPLVRTLEAVPRVSGIEGFDRSLQSKGNNSNIIVTLSVPSQLQVPRAVPSGDSCTWLTRS